MAEIKHILMFNMCYLSTCLNQYVTPYKRTLLHYNLCLYDGQYHVSCLIYPEFLGPHVSGMFLPRIHIVQKDRQTLS